MYRVRQFWRNVFLKTDHQALEQAKGQLTAAQWALFRQLQPAEKAHALSIYRKLIEQGDIQPDLLVAALLHDVGKLRYRLNPIERAMVVLMRAIVPLRAHQFGEIPASGWERLPGWRKAFIVAAHHEEWGAEMAHQAGTSALAEALIRWHHQPNHPEAGEEENALLHKLWLIDNES